jgi:outer membrane protein TolC
VDQATQDELSARDRWVNARQSYARRLDSFKNLLGLPTDASVELETAELTRLADAAAPVLERVRVQAQEILTEPLPADAPVTLEPPSREEAGPYELEEHVAVNLALENRLDLRTAKAQVEDAQRKVVVAADGLRAELTLGGSMSAGERRSLGSATADDASIQIDEGRYDGSLTLDLPLERTAERNVYRASLIDLEAAARDLQELEDSIKLDVRNSLRNLVQSRSSLRIESVAVRLAARRVASTDLLLQAGRAEIRDLLEAQEDLVNAQDAMTRALVDYRIAELELQRDMGVLEIDDKGMWTEFDPEGLKENG